MTIREFVEELLTKELDQEVVVVGHSWAGSSEPETYLASPELSDEDGKVVIRA